MLRGTTPVPNLFFDGQMAGLSASAVRVYLKIVRNTWGWRDRDGRVKRRDWISHSQFLKVGVSSRSVTKAVEELLERGLIRITDDHGNSLSDPKKRKLAKRLYYAPIAHSKEENTYNNAKTTHNNAENGVLPGQNPLSTKETLTKERLMEENAQGTERLTDSQRMNQIKEEQQRKQVQRDNWLYQ